MIAYLDSSVVVRAYLADEQGHDAAIAVLADPELSRITARLTQIEVTGALVRAAMAARGDRAALLDAFEADLAPGGPIAVVAADQAAIEAGALAIVHEHALRALDAWHLAVAALTLPLLAEPGEPLGFATRDEAQADAATALGLHLL